MRTMLRSAAIILSLIWLFYLLNGWIEYSNLVSYNIPDPFGIKEKAVQKAFNSLIFQTIFALILLLGGIFMSGSPSENGESIVTGTLSRMIKSQKDFFSGLMFTAIGGAFAWGATNYSVGTAARMGPGYFPLLLGILLAALGCFTTFYSLIEHTEDGEKIGDFAWRPVVYILGANVAFGILLAGLPSLGLPPMGLIAGIYALTIISSKAGDVFKLKDVLILATFLSVLSYLAFIKLLNLQMPVWPFFITG